MYIIIILYLQYKSKSFIDFIPNFIQNNHAPINNSVNTPINIQNENEKHQLKDEIEKYKKKCDEYKKEIENLKKENIKLNEELSKLKKINSTIQNYQIENNELNKLKEENVILKYQLNMKDKEINDLKSKIGIKETKVNLDDIIVIYFTPNIIVIYFTPKDSSFYQGIKCVKTETFAEVEEKLCKIHNELRNTNNTFTANALPILRFKTIAENNIKDGDVIQLYKIE